MKWQSILIVTYGRSGSTLLSGVLNSIDEYLIRGENRQCFFGLYRYWKALEVTHGVMRKSPQCGATHPWWNDVAVDDVLERLRALARFTLCKERTPRVFGFKEIRYVPDDDPWQGFSDYAGFADYLQFLKLLFPGCCFVTNTRNIDEVVQSRWWRADVERSRRVIETAEGWYRQFAAAADNCFAITYEDVVHSTDRLRELFAFLGEEYRQDRIDAVLRVRHSY